MSDEGRAVEGGARSLLRQPLLHFLVLGLVLFGLYSTVSERTGEAEKRIVVSAQQIELLSSLWAKQWRRAPTAEELDGLIRSYVREEVLYREALAMGLDRDDTVIRRRLAQKIEFLAQDLASQVEPTAAELETFYAEHQEIFEEPARTTFTHVYINVDTHGAAATEVAAQVLAELEGGGDPRQLGDRFMLQSDYLRKSPQEVSRHFGSEFASAVFELDIGGWTGPLRSGYGLHLVRVADRSEPYLRPLEEVRDKVRDELLSFRRREMDEQLYARLSEGYEIVIEEPQAAAAEAARGSVDAPVTPPAKGM